jgi:uncharacterized protein YjbJ (UPF0337 family)
MTAETLKMLALLAMTAQPVPRKKQHMNWTQMEGKWQQMKGQVKTRWGKLTDDDLTQIEGHRDVLLGKLRERYGDSKETLEDELDQWVTSLDENLRAAGERKRTKH